MLSIFIPFSAYLMVKWLLSCNALVIYWEMAVNRLREQSIIASGDQPFGSFEFSVFASPYGMC